MGLERGLTAQVVSRYGVASIALGGQLDTTTVSVLEEHLAYYEDDGVVAIMLDLRDLTYLDTTGLQALLRAKDRARSNGHRLILVGASRPARRVFERTGTQFLMDDQEAMGALERFLRAQARKPDPPA